MEIDMTTLDDCTEFTVCMDNCMHGRMDANGYQGYQSDVYHYGIDCGQLPKWNVNNVTMTLNLCI